MFAPLIGKPQARIATRPSGLSALRWAAAYGHDRDIEQAQTSQRAPQTGPRFPDNRSAVAWDFSKVRLYPQGRRSGSERPSPAQAPRPPIQAKLEVGPVNDPLERQADRAAEALLAGRSANPGIAYGGRGRGGGGVAPAKSGMPLDIGSRHRFGLALGMNLADVRVHTDRAAAALTEAHDAQAATYGRDIYFAPNAYAPSTPTGARLLAHEVAHVAQQARGAPRLQRKPKPLSDEDRHRIAVAASDWLYETELMEPWQVIRRAQEAQDSLLADISLADQAADAALLLRLHDALQRRAHKGSRDADGALLYTPIFEHPKPWTEDRPHEVADIPLFAPDRVATWRRIVAAIPTAQAGREAPPPSRHQETEPAREPPKTAVNVTFRKAEKMTFSTLEGQQQIMFALIAATHPGYLPEQIAWVVEKIGTPRWAAPDGKTVEEWQAEIEQQPVGAELTMTVFPNFQVDVGALLYSAPSERDIMLEAYRRGVIEGRFGVYLGLGTFALGTIALTGGASAGLFLGAADAAAASGSILLAEGTYVPSLVGGQFGSALVGGYLNAPVIYANATFAIGALGAGYSLSQHLGDIRQRGFRRSDIGDIAGDISSIGIAYGDWRMSRWGMGLDMDFEPSIPGSPGPAALAGGEEPVSTPAVSQVEPDLSAETATGSAPGTPGGVAGAEPTAEPDLTIPGSPDLVKGRTGIPSEPEPDLTEPAPAAVIAPGTSAAAPSGASRPLPRPFLSGLKARLLELTMSGVLQAAPAVKGAASGDTPALVEDIPAPAPAIAPEPDLPGAPAAPAAGAAQIERSEPPPATPAAASISPAAPSATATTTPVLGSQAPEFWRTATPDLANPAQSLQVAEREIADISARREAQQASQHQEAVQQGQIVMAAGGGGQGGYVRPSATTPDPRAFGQTRTAGGEQIRQPPAPDATKEQRQSWLTALYFRFQELSQRLINQQVTVEKAQQALKDAQLAARRRWRSDRDAENDVGVWNARGILEQRRQTVVTTEGWMQDVNREITATARALLAGSKPWREVRIARDDTNMIGLYGELEVSTILQARGWIPIGSTLNASEILDRNDLAVALKNYKGQQGIDGIYMRVGATGIEYLIIESKTTLDIAGTPTGTAALEVRSNGLQGSKNWVVGNIHRAGVTQDQRDDIERGLGTSSARVIYAQTDPRGTRFFLIDFIGDIGAKIGNPFD